MQLAIQLASLYLHQRSWSVLCMSGFMHVWVWAVLCPKTGVLKVYIQRSKSELSSVSKVWNNWLLQNLFLIKIHNMHNKSTNTNKINSPLHSKYINNKCKSGKTINLSVSIRGRPIGVFLAIDGQYIIFLANIFTFTFMHLADASIQSDFKVQGSRFLYLSHNSYTGHN